MSDKIVFRKGLLENLEDLPIAAPGFITNPGEERLVIGGAKGNVFLPNAKDINEINSSLNALTNNASLHEVTDCNLATDIGKQYLAKEGAQSRPVMEGSIWYILENKKAYDDNLMQFAYPVNDTHNYYFRILTPTGWGYWREVISTNNIVNNYTTTENGFILDARVGKAIMDYINQNCKKYEWIGLDDGYDLNNLTENGKYKVMNPVNCPYQGDIFVYVEKYQDRYIRQEMRGAWYSGDIATRVCNNGVWQEWFKYGR